MKKHKMLVEFIKKEETKDGAIPLLDSINISGYLGKVAKKFGYDCYMKAYPKSKLDYKPTYKKYEIKTIKDIANLTPEQFEFFIDDLREYFLAEKKISAIKGIPGIISIESSDGFTRVDDGGNEKNYNIHIKTTNNLP